MSGAKKIYKNKIHLTDLNSCRKYMARVINQLDEGIIDGKAARDRGYCIKIVADLIIDGDLSRRVEELEAIVENEYKK